MTDRAPEAQASKGEFTNPEQMISDDMLDRAVAALDGHLITRDEGLARSAVKTALAAAMSAPHSQRPRRDETGG